MIQMRVMDPIPRLDDRIKEKLKGQEIQEMIHRKYFRGDPDLKVNYERRREKLVVRKGSTRFCF